MKKFLPYLTLLFAIAGFVLLLFENKLLQSFYILTFLTPVCLMSTFMVFKESIMKIDFGFRISFIIISILTPFIILIGSVFRLQHYPGSQVFFIVIFILDFIQLTLGIFYLFQKRKVINAQMLGFLLLVLYPILLSLWFRTERPNETLEKKHNLALWEITKIEEEKNFSKLNNLDSLSLKRYNEISQIKKSAIKWTDGLDENGVPICLHCRDIESFSNNIVLDSNQIDTRYIKLFNEAKTLAELNLILTEIQTSLILEHAK